MTADARSAGPFESRDDTRQAPAVAAVYAMLAVAGAGQALADGHNAKMITDACDRAGVDLGAYDRRIIAWAGGWDPEVAAVLAGLIIRAAATS